MNVISIIIYGEKKNNTNETYKYNVLIFSAIKEKKNLGKNDWQSANQRQPFKYISIVRSMSNSKYIHRIIV